MGDHGGHVGLARSGKVSDIAYLFTSSYGDEILRRYYISIPSSI